MLDSIIILWFNAARCEHRIRIQIWWLYGVLNPDFLEPISF